jgi:hypothetical protein
MSLKETMTEVLNNVGKKVGTTGKKFDEGKLDWTLIDWASMEGFVKRLQCGEVKYGRDNWKEVPDAIERYQKALLRHVFQYLKDGGDLEDTDDPLMKGTTHLDAAMCCLMFLKRFEEFEK